MVSEVITKQEIQFLLPHAEPMVLLDQVDLWDEHQIHCSAASHTDITNPMRIDGQLSIFAGIEYAAQAMALHYYLNTRNQTGIAPKQGFVAVVSDVNAAAEYLDETTGRLLVIASKLETSGNSSLYDFAIYAGGNAVLTGRQLVVLADK